MPVYPPTTRSPRHAALLLFAAAGFALLAGAGCGKDEPIATPSAERPADNIPATGEKFAELTSADGKWSAFATLSSADDFFSDLSVVNTSSGWTRTVHAPGALPISFAPDGSSLVFAAQSDKRVASLFVLPLTSTTAAIVQVTNVGLAPGDKGIIRPPYQARAVNWIGTHIQYTNPGDSPVDVDTLRSGNP